MSIVKINALTAKPGFEDELVRRFKNNLSSLDGLSGFEGFRLLAPVSGDDRYLAVTQWADEESFQAWRQGPAKPAHGEGPNASTPKEKTTTAFHIAEYEVVAQKDPQ